MAFSRAFPRTLAAVAVGAGLTFAEPALAVPAAFTSQGVATSYQDGQATKIPNTLHYNRGRIRLEMVAPKSENSSAAFPVVLAKEGGDVITLLNQQEKQAMRIPASTLDEVTNNPSLQKISHFKMNEFGATFRSQSRKVGAEPVAGEPCTVLEQKGKDGHFRMWVSDKHEIPLKFVYFEGGKPSFDYEVTQFSATAKLSESDFAVPSGYQTIDLAEMLKGGGHQ